jgi:NADPH:quinone reductase-like Zn-dependent oxidoreductase
MCHLAAEICMRAFAIDRFGDEGSLRDLPVPEVGEDEVLVRLHAAGVQPADWHVRRGDLADRFEHVFPVVLGMDGMGVVEAVGANVTRLSHGENVYGSFFTGRIGRGTYADYIVVPQGAAIGPSPDLEPTFAASIPGPALTAMGILGFAQPAPGSTVVLVGASGGVGSMATQLFARAGSHVIAVSSDANRNYVTELGASEVLDYRTVNVVETLRSRYPGGVDVVVDLVSDRAGLRNLATTVRRGGRVVAPSRVPTLIDDAETERYAKSGITAAHARGHLSPDNLAVITRLVADGELRPPQVSERPLAEAAEALAESEGRHVRGRIALRIEGAFGDANRN